GVEQDERGAGVGSRAHVGALACEGELDELASVGIVFDDEDAPRFEPAHAFGETLIARALVHTPRDGRDRERRLERASLADAIALGAHRAAMRFDDVTDDGEAEAHAARGPRRSSVGLTERHERLRDERWFHSASRIANDDADGVGAALERELDSA